MTTLVHSLVKDSIKRININNIQHAKSKRQQFHIKFKDKINQLERIGQNYEFAAIRYCSTEVITCKNRSTNRSNQQVMELFNRGDEIRKSKRHVNLFL